MRFCSHRVKGIGPFKDEVGVDYDALPGEVTAVVGPNGEGKTTFLGTMAGAVLPGRKHPNHGALVGLAVGLRDSFVETSVINGAPHVIRHTLDGVAGTSEALVLDANGNPRLSSTSVRGFDAWAKETLPSQEVLYSGQFSRQGKLGILDMEDGDRKAVVLRVLGVEYLENLAKKARDRASAAKVEIEKLEARRKDLLDGYSVAQATEAIEHLKAEASDAEAALGKARAMLDAAKHEAARVTAHNAEAQRILVERGVIDARKAGVASKLADLQKRIENNQEVIQNADDIRAAASEHARIEAHIVDIGAERARIDASQEILSSKLLAVHDRIRERGTRLARLGEVASFKAKVEPARNRLAAIETELKALGVCVKSTRVALEEARNASMGGAAKRIAGLRSGLERIVRFEEALPIAADTLEADDTLADTEKAAPAKLKELNVLAQQQDDTIADLTDERERLSPIVAGAGEIDRAESEFRELETAGYADSRAQDELASEYKVVAKRLDTLRGEYDRLHQRREELAPKVKLLDRLTQAEARLAELEPQYDALATEYDGVLTKLEELPEPPAMEAMPDLNDREAALVVAESVARRAASAVAVGQSELARAVERSDKAQTLKREQGVAIDELADWQLLADSLGRDGLQAFEVDAAGPELSEITNDLLHNCLGTRWTVTWETTKLDAKGKNLLEGCPIMVLDTKTGREADGRAFSGGEKVLIGEACSLALVTLACRRYGSESPTIVRDESGANLDPPKARAYMSMLRRASANIGASRVLIVTHSPDVAALADSVLHVHDGRIDVEGPDLDWKRIMEGASAGPGETTA